MRYFLPVEKIKEKCKTKYPDWDFSDLDYIDEEKTMVSFHCEKHGKVEERKRKLLSCNTKIPCPKCRIESRSLAFYGEKFFRKAKEKFGDNLDFSKSVYLGNSKPIEFVCKKHGLQKSSPSAILRSPCGCSKCSIEQRSKNATMSTEDFIKKALSIPGFEEKYDYSGTKYVNNHTKVRIFCKDCQEYFWILPGNHISLKQGHGKCNFGYKRSSEEYKEELEKLCGDKLDFSLSNIKKGSDNIEIICKEKSHHFWRSPQSVLAGHTSCPYCSGNYIKSTEEYKRFLQEYFGDSYDFSEVNYKNRLSPVKIICPDHGMFLRTPASILDVIREGKSILCPHCSRSEGEKKIKEYLENHNINYFTQHKFKECKYQKELPFDFYLPDYNLCIEYQGKQHYQPIKTWGGENTFKKVNKRDSIKKKFCLEKGINFLEIKYDIPISEIFNVLDNYFKNEIPSHLLLDSSFCCYTYGFFC